MRVSFHNFDDRVLIGIDEPRPRILLKIRNYAYLEVRNDPEMRDDFGRLWMLTFRERKKTRLITKDILVYDTV